MSEYNVNVKIDEEAIVKLATERAAEKLYRDVMSELNGYYGKQNLVSIVASQILSDETDRDKLLEKIVPDLCGRLIRSATLKKAIIDKSIEIVEARDAE